jgi:uncharacterized membrane protein YfbV (UPF0208 family)
MDRYGLIEQAGKQLAEQGIAGMGPRVMTLRERLIQQKSQMQQRVKEIEEAIALLDRNPDFEKLQDLLSR